MLQKTSQYDPSSLSGILFKAEVIDNVDPTNQGRIKVVIPKIMVNNRPDESPIKNAPAKKMNPAKKVENKEDNQFKTSVKTVNFIWARPIALINNLSTEKTVTSTVENESPKEREKTFKDVKIGEDLKMTNYVACSGSLRIPRIRTRVYVIFEDGDIKKCYYLPFGPTLESEYINTDTVENEIDADTPNKRVNIDVIRTWQNGSMLYYDTNDEANVFCFKTQNGHRYKFEFNKDASGITMNTESGHHFKMIDMSEGDTGDSFGNTWNQVDNNEEDYVPKGKFICLETSNGHKILMDDNIENEKIHIITAGGHTFDMVDCSSLENGSFFELPHYENHDAGQEKCSYIRATTSGGNSFIMFDKSEEPYSLSRITSEDEILNQDSDITAKHENDLELTGFPFIQLVTTGGIRCIMSDFMDTYRIINNSGTKVEAVSGRLLTLDTPGELTLRAGGTRIIMHAEGKDEIVIDANKTKVTGAFSVANAGASGIVTMPGIAFVQDGIVTSII